MSEELYPLTKSKSDLFAGSPYPVLPLGQASIAQAVAVMPSGKVVWWIRPHADGSTNIAQQGAISAFRALGHVVVIDTIEVFIEAVTERSAPTHPYPDDHGDAADQAYRALGGTVQAMKTITTPPTLAWAINQFHAHLREVRDTTEG